MDGMIWNGGSIDTVSSQVVSVASMAFRFLAQMPRSTDQRWHPRMRIYCQQNTWIRLDGHADPNGLTYFYHTNLISMFHPQTTTLGVWPPMCCHRLKAWLKFPFHNGEWLQFNLPVLNGQYMMTVGFFTDGATSVIFVSCLLDGPSPQTLTTTDDTILTLAILQSASCHTSWK